MKRGKEQISRADLLLALHNSDQQVAEPIAQQLGLKYSTEFKVREDIKLGSKAINFISGTLLAQPATSSFIENVRPPKGFWYLDKREQNKPLELTESSDLSQLKPVIWRNKPGDKPQHILLASPQEIVSRLQPYFIAQRKSRSIDVARVIKKLSQGESIKKLSRLSKKYNSSPIHIIDDRQTHLTPYWLDHEAVSFCLQSQYKDIEHTRAVLLEGEQTPRKVSNCGLDKWQIPVCPCTVIILSDLGVLAPDNTQQVKIWLNLGRKLQRNQVKAIVLLPCEKDQCDPRFKSFFHLESWQVSADKIDKAKEISQQVEYILTLLGPSIRIEPSLIRQMRLVLLASTEHTQNWQFPIAIESILWQHPAIQERHSVAATWVSAKRKQYLDAFELLSPHEQTTALEVIRAWRGELLSHQVWFEELSSLSSSVQQLNCIRQDVKDVSAYFQQLSVQSQQNNGMDIPQTRLSWFKRLESRIPDNSFEQSIYLQRISSFVHKDEPNVQAKNIDPRNLLLNKKPEQLGVLIQQADRLCLQPYTIKDGRPVSYIKGFKTPLAFIRLRFLQVQIRVNNKNYGSLILGDTKSIQLPGKGELTVISDEEVLHFSLVSIASSPLFQITENIARDQYGLYTDLTINSITQRFRYIEPGSFLMGSPEAELEREPWKESKETQHQVILTEGFWLADTTATQALYQAVMDENPSHFKDDLNYPVETVSWEDAQKFIEKLNAMIPRLQAQLPSEAQWEYACRAGSHTAFSFGENITTEQVNYNGLYPYAGSKMGFYRKKTVAVKSLPANPWGLYEMHGNIWEWCDDWFQKDLGNNSVVDPIGAEAGANRVVRGGSWDDVGGYVPSAVRYGYKPVGRDDGVGFRLSLNVELQGTELK